MSEFKFPDTVKISVGGEPAAGEFIGFGELATRDGIKVNHFGLPLLLDLKPEMAAGLVNGQQVVFRYRLRTAEKGTVSAVWTASALAKLLAPAGEWLVQWSDQNDSDRDIAELLTDPEAVYERACVILGGVMATDQENGEEVAAIDAAFPSSVPPVQYLLDQPVGDDQIYALCDDGKFVIKRQK